MEKLASQLVFVFLLAVLASDALSQVPGSYVQTGRYTNTRLEPETFQSELFTAPVTIKFGRPVDTIGEALLEVLDGSGYQLSPEHLYQRALYNLALPEVLRSIGPLPLHEALQVLAGKAWVVGVDDLTKTVYFDLDTVYEDRKTEVLNRLEQGAALMPQTRRSIGTVPFAVGEYSKLGPQGQEQFSQLVERTKLSDSWIEIIGHSQSRQGWATQRLALLRANLIKDQLVQSGVSAERISVSAEVKNNSQGKLLHAASVYVVTERTAAHDSPLSLTASAPMLISRCGKVRFQPGSLKTNVRKALEDCNYTIAEWNFGEPTPVPTTFDLYLEGMDPLLNFLRDNYGADSRINQLNATVDFSPMASDFCGDVNFDQGSLKQNISVALEGCGYTMGRWNFGDPNYELDWSVNKAFKVNVEGIQPFLEFIRVNYLIDFHVNHVDSTIDFFPKARG